MATKSAEHQEFADPNTGKKLDCDGRPYAKCHKCRDWHFTGDHASWTWFANWPNWQNNEWHRFFDDRMHDKFTKRTGATCSYPGGRGNPHPVDPDDGFGLEPHHLCICEIH